MTNNDKPIFDCRFVETVFGFTRAQLWWYANKSRIVQGHKSSPGGKRWYTFYELLLFRIIRNLRQCGTSMRVATRVARKLKERFPSLENLSGITLTYERGVILLIKEKDENIVAEDILSKQHHFVYRKAFTAATANHLRSVAEAACMFEPRIARRKRALGLSQGTAQT